MGISIGSILVLNMLLSRYLGLNKNKFKKPFY